MAVMLLLTIGFLIGSVISSVGGWGSFYWVPAFPLIYYYDTFIYLGFAGLFFVIFAILYIDRRRGAYNNYISFREKRQEANDE